MRVIRQQHCWHAIGGYTLGMGGGVDSFKCCRCGREQDRTFKELPHWEHGPHVPVMTRQYQDEALPSRLCVRTKGNT